MKLYEVNQAIVDAIDRLDVDPDTGEMGANAEEVMEEINALDMERNRILQYLAKLILNLRAESDEIKAEEQRLKKRRTAVDNKVNRIMDILDRECDGKKTDLGVATVCYRKTSSLFVGDEDEAIRWLAENHYDSCLKVKDPEISKTEVKKLINSGVEVPQCEIVEGCSMSLR